jgi:CoA:oxalate CoA-transferase
VAEGLRLFEGIRVVEFGQYVAVPYAAELLAHGGADVVKVEPIGGDNTRTVQPLVPGEGRQFIIKARGKRAITVDMTDERGRDAVRRLILDSHVVLSNMRPGSLERMGLGYEQIAPQHPTVIYGEISAFGTRGPEANKPGLDPVVQAGAGLIAAGRATEDGRPVPSEAFLSDYMAGTLLAFGVVSALRLAEQTGRGQFVSTSLLQAALALEHGQASIFHALDGWKVDFVRWLEAEKPTFEEAARRRRSMLATDHWWLNTYVTADGVIALGAPGPLRRRLVQVTGVDDPAVTDPSWTLPDDPRPYIREVTARAREAIATWKTDDLLARLEEAGIPCSRVRFMEEVLLSEHARANGYVYTADHPRVGEMTLPAAPVQFSDSRYVAAGTTPAYGEHTAEVLRELGFTPEEIETLRAAGIAVCAE